MSAPRVAYITTGYPYVSHSFIQSEVLALRRLGVEVHTFAVRRSKPSEVLSDQDRREFKTTYALRPASFRHYASAHLGALISRPGHWLRTLRRALSMSDRDLRSLVWATMYFVQAVVLWDRVRRVGVRHIHAHFANVSSDLALLAAELGGEGWSWSFTMHGPTEFADVSRFKLGEKAEAAKFVACISDFCRSQLMALLAPAHWPKLIVVRCGVDPARFVPQGRRPPGQAFEVLCVARMTEVKGHFVLLDALDQLRRDDKRVRATFVGDGPLREEIEARSRVLDLEDRVSFAGAVSQDELPEMFARADVFCLPSFAEGVPIVLMEAMATELPVVCSRVAGIPELVEDGETGLVVTPGRSDVLAGAMDRLLGDSELRSRLGEAGRRRVRSAYDAGENARDLAAQFARIVAPAPPA